MFRRNSCGRASICQKLHSIWTYYSEGAGEEEYFYVNKYMNIHHIFNSFIVFHSMIICHKLFSHPSIDG